MTKLKLVFLVGVVLVEVSGSMFRSSFTMKVQNGCETKPEVSVEGKTTDNLLITTSLSPKKFLGREKTSFLRPWDEDQMAEKTLLLKFECDNYLVPCKVDHILSLVCTDGQGLNTSMELQGTYLFSRTAQDFFISSFSTTMVFTIAVLIYSSRFWKNYLVYFGPKVGQQMKKSLEQPDATCWLSDYYMDDLGDCSNLVFLPEYPSSFCEEATFKNINGVYQIHDYPAPDESYLSELRPNRNACVIGSGISVALTNRPSPTIMEHWRVSIPNYKRPVIKKINKRYKFSAKKHITLFPMENLEKNNHLIDPQAHYETLSKLALRDMEVECPKHYDAPVKYPCMIKASHGLGNKGTYRATTEGEAKEIEMILKNEFKCLENQIVYTDVVMNMKESVCAQFYLSKFGFVRWIGVSEQQVDEDIGKWIGGYFDHNTQPALEAQCRPYCDKVAKYLHNKGYFGVVGVDILFNDTGGYVIDVNPRLNGSTPALLIAKEMSNLGFNYGFFKTGCQFAGTEEDLVEKVDELNAQGHLRIVVLSTAEKESITFLGAPILEAHIAAYTLIKNDVFSCIDDMLKQFDANVV